MLGKTLQASASFDLEESAIIDQLAKSSPANNPNLRDAFSYRLSINKGEPISFDPALLKGSLKKVVGTLEDQLTAG